MYFFSVFRPKTQIPNRWAPICLPVPVPPVPACLQVAALKATTQRGGKVLRGSGSSAVSLYIWRVQDTVTASAQIPISLSYRAIGSGGG